MARLTPKLLKKLKIPNLLIPGLILATLLGWKAGALDKIKSFTELKPIFPAAGIVAKVEDGDTIILKNGVTIRLIGVDAPPGVTRAQNFLTETLMNKKVFLEYDRYQDDKYGRTLAWVWLGCESTPKFLPADYMHKNQSASNPGLIDNPEGCINGKLINEELATLHLAETVKYKDRGELKYEKRIQFKLDLQSSK